LFIEMKNITKRFPGVVANDNISIKLGEGKVYAIVGENGAGKTTLMRCLCGELIPDAGEIHIDGVKVTISNPRKAMDAGIGMVHQRPLLFSSLNVLENIILEKEPSHFFGSIDRKNALNKIKDLMEHYGLEVDISKKVQDLSMSERQKVEILRLLYRNAKVLIFDEPTTYISPEEVEKLFGIFKKLVDENKIVIFISHKLDEIMEISDEIIVLKDGKVRGILKNGSVSRDDLSKLMLGDVPVHRSETASSLGSKEILFLDGISYVDGSNVVKLSNLSFRVNEGDIVGVTSFDGIGLKELAEIIVGIRKPVKGRIILKGKDITELDLRARRDLGISYIPEDPEVSVCPDMTVWENMVSTVVHRKVFSRGSILRFKNILKFCERAIEGYGVKVHSLKASVKTLSGGNIRKLIIARELSSNPTVLVAVEPTEGLDFKSVALFRKKLDEIRKKGAIILFSSDFEELSRICDRVLILERGRLEE